MLVLGTAASRLCRIPFLYYALDFSLRCGCLLKSDRQIADSPWRCPQTRQELILSRYHRPVYWQPSEKRHKVAHEISQPAYQLRILHPCSGSRFLKAPKGSGSGSPAIRTIRAILARKRKCTTGLRTARARLSLPHSRRSLRPRNTEGSPRGDQPEQDRHRV